MPTKPQTRVESKLLMTMTDSRDGDGSSTGSEEPGVGILSPSGEFSVSSADHRSSSGMGIKQQAALKERQTLAKQETKIIWILRLCVAFVFIAIALAASLSVYHIVSDREKGEFNDQFYFHAARVIEAFTIAIRSKLSAIDSLAVTYTTHALSSGSTFPNVTLPYFEYSGSVARVAGDAIIIYFAPLVTEETKDGWLSYISSQQDEMVRSIQNEEIEKRIQDNIYGHEHVNVSYPSILVKDYLIPKDVMNPPIEPRRPLKEPYFPVWQATPLLPEAVQVIGLNLGQTPFAEGSIDVVYNRSQASLDVMSQLDNTQEAHAAPTSMYNLFLQHGQYRHRAERYRFDPVTSLSMPVFDTFGPGRKVSGMLFTTMYWNLFLKNIFSDNVRGLLFVLTNTLGQQASYRIDGSEATFLGFGDFHSSKYDDMVREINVVDYVNSNANVQTKTFTAVDLSNDFIDYNIRVYPTDDFRDTYITDDAKIESITIGCSFIVAIFIFIVYDCCVERRQRIVLDRAVKSTALVSTLFPENVRERVINDGDGHARTGRNGKAAADHEKETAFKTFNVAANQTIGGSPIAEKFPETTVFFADLAGFTKWSSSREPEQVFHLLETMFKAFDAIALKRGVFKVETIGDCYMAVTGLPEPQSDHAVRMAKFASDCLHKLAHIVDNLAERLGEDTSNLTLRIGMHSGGVTGGVLRGDKSRFQLFGDTVNTASRMESTGVPGRVQASQTAADCLIINGKADWLKARDVKVFAKGKGEMQTYWIHADDHTASEKSSGLTASSHHQRQIRMVQEAPQKAQAAIEGPYHSK